ncbi:MAG: NADP-dependent oxidoreductase [Anaerolineae bacterium]|nr:NADP-dependent oxidoreductase [Anaerolineae bacterium]
MSTEKTMQAIALDKFGGIEAMQFQTIAIPRIEANQVLIRVDVAGVGVWDPYEREGGYAEALPDKPRFPYVLGSEGAGEVVDIGSHVNNINVGDRVYATAFLNPKGGFYAEYAVVDSSLVALVPDYLTMQQAGVMGGIGTTALRGLDDILKIKPDETLLILGASGGIGHIAVQLAKGMGASVFAVASGKDGVEFVTKLGADRVVDGRQDDVPSLIKAFAPEGLGAALLTAGGEVAERILSHMPPHSRVAYPNGIQPVSREYPGLQITAYNGEPDADIIRRFDKLIKARNYIIHVAQVFPLKDAQMAHQTLDSHYLGKLALGISNYSAD